jgi:hypothetical protein
MHTKHGRILDEYHVDQSSIMVIILFLNKFFMSWLIPRIEHPFAFLHHIRDSHLLLSDAWFTVVKSLLIII